MSLELARAVFESEAQAIHALSARIEDNFQRVVDMITTCKGRVVFFAVGKSGIVGHKVAATMASIGIPAYFMHAGESRHGDIGSLMADDLVIAISYGGESDEILSMLPVLRRIGVRVVAITGKPDSTLGKSADVVLDIGPDLGQGMIGWTHLSSIAASMAIGDALAIAAGHARGFSQEDFIRYHPGGSYGKEVHAK